MKRLVFLFLLCACASAAPKKTDEPDPNQDAHLFYPLAIGNSWTYAESRTGKRETIKIVGQDGAWLLDDHGGRLRYEPDGVRDADRYLLRTPITTGAKWSAVENLVVQRFEVTAVGAAAGRFTGCAVVRNEQPIPKGGKFITEWTYAPKVGLVQIRTFTVAASGKEQEQTNLQLVDYKVQ